MVKLDVSLLRYLSSDDFRILTSVEMGMKNHELVPASLVASIASVKCGGIAKRLHELTRQKLLSYERGKRFDGYRLNCLGYDYLALNVFRQRNVVSQVGNQIGVGKESDVFLVCNDDGERFVLKVHRLGRTSFRSVAEKRDYSNGKVGNWIYLSRIAALREYSFMKALHEKGFSVPKPVDSNRNCVVMELIPGLLLNHITSGHLPEPEKLYHQLLNMILSLANDYGLVHGDFNEFNILVREKTFDPVLIDFPQMVATSHKFAKKYFDRDVNCIVDFFKKRFDIIFDHPPTYEKDVLIDNPDKKGIDVIDIDELSEHLEAADIGLDHVEEVDQPVTSPEPIIPEPENLEPKILEPIIPEPENLEPKVLEPENLEPKVVEGGGGEIVEVDGNGTEVWEGSDGSLEEGSVYSITSMSTFLPEEIKKRIRRERAKEKKVEDLKLSKRKMKGESSAVLRKRKDDEVMIRLDLRSHREDGLL